MVLFSFPSLFSVFISPSGDNSSHFLKSIEDTLSPMFFYLCLAKYIYINFHTWTFAGEVCCTQVPIREDTALGGECSRVIKQPKSSDCTSLGCEVSDLNSASRFLYLFCCQTLSRVKYCLHARLSWAVFQIN